MPFTGEIDVTQILANLGDPNHGLRPAGSALNQEQASDDDHPHRATMGPLDMSTNTALARPCEPIWDVNGYYRGLGLAWPFRPTRKELRTAYQAKDGWKSERLTYYLKQLLDPVVRRKYDAMPLGHRMDDKYTQEENKRKLADVAKEVSEEEGRLVTVDDLIAEQEAYEKMKPKRDELPGKLGWIWGYYLLKSRKFESENLELWQQYLIKAFADLGLAERISIGYVGDTDRRFRIIEHDNRVIFFLNEDEEPTPELAETAVSFFGS